MLSERRFGWGEKSPKGTECALIRAGYPKFTDAVKTMAHRANSTLSATKMKRSAAESPAPLGIKNAEGSVPLQWTPAATGVGITLLAVLGSAYAEPLANLGHRWAHEPDYSHGFLVPVFAAYLFWTRRKSLQSPSQFATLFGVVLLAAASAMRWFSAHSYYPLVDAPSLIPCLAGVVLLIGGWSALSWSWPSIAFLVFMMPLPAAVATLLSHPLQRVATVCSTWLVQLCGVPAIARGNVIWLTAGKIGVVEACSGLRMLMLFLAITVGATFVINRPLWEKVFVALSALIIAVIANIIRITTTAVLYEYVGQQWADKVFHDLAGWLMMPVAVALLFLELYVLNKLLVAPASAVGPMMLRRTGAGAMRSA
jgi:exosortase